MDFEIKKKYNFLILYDLFWNRLLKKLFLLLNKRSKFPVLTRSYQYLCVYRLSHNYIWTQTMIVFKSGKFILYTHPFWLLIEFDQPKNGLLKGIWNWEQLVLHSSSNKFFNQLTAIWYWLAIELFRTASYLQLLFKTGWQHWNKPTTWQSPFVCQSDTTEYW